MGVVLEQTSGTPTVEHNANTDEDKPSASHWNSATLQMFPKTQVALSQSPVGHKYQITADLFI